MAHKYGLSFILAMTAIMTGMAPRG